MSTDLTEITVIGDDDTGLIARITTLLFEREINIEDLDQAVHEGLFRMTMHVDTSEMDTTPDELRSALSELGEDLGLDIQVRFPSDRETRRIAVLVTKESHCLEALFDADDADEIAADIHVVISNHDDLRPMTEERDLPYYDIGDDKGTPDEEQLLEILDDHDVDLIVLARYMRILSPNVVFRYEDRIINVHPSLLPSFPGAQAYLQAIEEGVRIAGVTAHYVTTHLDQGPIIAQRAFSVPVDADVESLKRIGQPLEAEVLIEAIQLHLDDAIAVHRGRTHLRNGVAEHEYQFGLPREIEDLYPSHPIDRNSQQAETD